MTSMIKSQGALMPLFDRNISMVLGGATILIWSLCLYRAIRTILKPNEINDAKDDIS